MNFEDYLKKLEELKKTLRDENNDDEEKNMEDDVEEDSERKEENNSSNKNKDIKMKILRKKENMKKKKNKQSKLHIQKITKRKNMSNHFFKINFFFIIKIGVSFILLIIYFIATIILFNSYKKEFIEFDNSLVKINSIYFNIFKTLLIFKKQIENLLNDTNYEIEIPSDSELTLPQLGNTLLNIIHNSKYSSDYLETIKTLYNDNVCQVLTQYLSNDTYCEKIFSSLLLKGLDQAIVQMSIIIDNCLDELKALKKTKNLNIMYSINNYYYNYEILVGYYIFNSYLINRECFAVFREDEKNNIIKIKLQISIVFIIFDILIILLCCFFIYNYKKEGNSFWNFIAILPDKFISDDENFYDSVIKLEELLY